MTLAECDRRDKAPGRTGPSAQRRRGRGSPSTPHSSANHNSTAGICSPDPAVVLRKHCGPLHSGVLARGEAPVDRSPALEVAHRGAVADFKSELLLEKPMELGPRSNEALQLGRGILQRPARADLATRSQFHPAAATRRPFVIRASMPPRLNISIHSRSMRSLRQNCCATLRVPAP